MGKHSSPKPLRTDAMQITIKFIGRYIDLTGTKKFKLSILQGSSMWDVVDLVVKQYPQLEKDKKFLMVTKNNMFTNREAKIQDGDEITLSPPVVSGG